VAVFEALRPQDGGRGLFDRKQRNDQAQKGAGNPRDDRDQPGEPVWRSLSVVEGHEARSYATSRGPPTMLPARRAESRRTTESGRPAMLAQEKLCSRSKPDS
jgi:hypothetical protein